MSEPFPPRLPFSTYFLALSHAPPAFAINRANATQPKRPPANIPPKAIAPKPKPTSGFRILDKNKRPYFPSTLLINEGAEDGVSYGNYSRLTRADGKIGNIDYLQYSSDEIITNISPTLDYSKIPKTGNKTPAAIGIPIEL